MEQSYIISVYVFISLIRLHNYLEYTVIVYTKMGATESIWQLFSWITLTSSPVIIQLDSITLDNDICTNI